MSRYSHHSQRSYNTAIAITIGLFMLGGWMAYRQGGISPVMVTANSIGPPGDNPAIAMAKAEAKRTLSDFIATLQENRPEHRDFSVLVAIQAPDATHGKWMRDVTYSDGQFTGIPTRLPTDDPLEQAQARHASFPASQVIDWFYIEEDRIVGWHILRAMHSQLPPEQKRLYSEQMADLGLKFD